MSQETVRKNPRFSGYDYSAPGGYFITICCHRGKHVFGRIHNGRMLLNDTGSLAHTHWLQVSNHYSNIYLDVHVVMPNHLHALLAITNLNVGEASLAPTSAAHRCNSLASVIGNFKSGVTREARASLGWRGTLWQRSYHDHVIREPLEAKTIRKYIANNPLSWHLDKENAERSGDDPFDMWLSERSQSR